MANEVKHLQMTDGTICDIKNSAYLIKYTYHTPTMNLYQSGYSGTDLTPDSITDLQTGATVSTIPDIETADIYVILYLYGGELLTKVINFNATLLRAKGCSYAMSTHNIFSYVLVINKSNLRMTYYTVTPTTGADWDSIDRVVTVDTSFSVVSDFGASSNESFFNNGGVPPRVFFKGNNKFCYFRTWYFTDMNDAIITLPFYNLCNTHGSDVSYQFKLVFEYTIPGSNNGIKLTQTITNSNSGNMSFTPFTAAYI